MTERPDFVQIYQSADGDWRWHRLDGDNHEELSASSEGYEHREFAHDQAVKLNPGCRVEFKDATP